MGSKTSTILISLVSGAAGAVLIIALLFVGFFGNNLALLKSITGERISTSGSMLVTTPAEDAIVETVRNASPAVVSIVITKDVPIIEQYYEDDSFGGFVLPFPQYRERGTERREVGGGSGFLVSPDGLIITNRHVVAENEADYTVFTNDGKKYEASVVARDPVHDIAVLKIEGSNFPFLRFGSSDDLQVGQTVIAIGNALAEFRNSVSAGIVSGLARSIVAGTGSGSSEVLENVIQTDAAINPGNSGGPLLDLAGNVIGVNVAVARGSENIGFALPANLAKSVVESIQKTGRIVRPFLGVRYIQINEQVQQERALPVNYGVLIIKGDTDEEPAVNPGSPAEKAGIVENDILLEVDGKKLDGNTSLASIIRSKSVGDSIVIKILHNKEEKSLTVILSEVPQ